MKLSIKDRELLRCSPNIGILLDSTDVDYAIHMSCEHFGYSFICDSPTLWNAMPDIHPAPSVDMVQNGSKHTSTKRNTLHSLHQYTQLSFVVRDPCYVPGYGY